MSLGQGEKGERVGRTERKKVGTQCIGNGMREAACMSQVEHRGEAGMLGPGRSRGIARGGGSLTDRPGRFRGVPTGAIHGRAPLMALAG